MLFLLLVLLAGRLVAAGEASAPSSGFGPKAATLQIPVVFPEHPTTEPDAYLCTAVPLPDRPLKLVGVEPTSDEEFVHHMLLFGCKVPAQQKLVWPCKMTAACGQGGESVLYGWGKNANAIALPDGVGYSVGPGTGVQALVLQMHFLVLRPPNDKSGSGLTLHLGEQPVPYSAGMIAYAAGFRLPPGQPSILVPNSCCYAGWEPLHGFAARVHTHSMGREVYLDRSQPADRKALDRITGLDPQKPQGFYPIAPEATFLPGDQLAMACNFDSTNKTKEVQAGHTSSHEMCNLYLMLYSHLPVFMWCLDSQPWAELSAPGGLPQEAHLQPETKLWQPPAALPQPGGGDPYALGQVPGLAARGDGTVWAFHRGHRAWNPDGSVSDGGEGEVLAGPTVFQMDADTGKVLQSWGAGAFAMSHMLSFDWEGNMWLTDVGLHQAFKYSPDGQQLLVLGTRGTPGSDGEHLCKPTQVAVTRDGGVLVSDGYCNSRVAEFGADGRWVFDYKLPARGEAQMEVPHSVVYHECHKWVVVADRERGFVHGFKRPGGALLVQWDLHRLGLGNPYALALGPYGSILALTWEPDSRQTWVLALGDETDKVLRTYPLDEMDAPHDLVLLPAPLELSGAGERQLSILVSTTNDSGDNLHKFVLREGPAQEAGAAAGSEQAVVEEAAALEAAKAAAAAHFGGKTHAEAPAQALAAAAAEEEEEEEGPEEGGAKVGAAAKRSGEGEAVQIGHSLVKPVEGGEQQEQQAAEADQAEEQQQVAEAAQHEQAEQEAAAATTQQPEQQQPEQQQPDQQPENAADFVEREDKAEEEAALATQRSKAAAAEVADAAPAGSRPFHADEEDRALLNRAAAAQPWMLGLVFVAVALVSWHRLQHWRRRSGAGYHAAAGVGGADEGGTEHPGGHRHHLVHGHPERSSSAELPIAPSNRV
ncbi:peptidyl-glycine alpha-amidating monooxygenase [Micractinium conductrix]|uniref:Peptidyl-glycine alpha-amidating monooxygenase n=1 Tax=Micractinium conductrix TaxID=554055 RepID=A0A2P6VC27_9CHLO|nr:peptidyl-glycine alpha-amidating monooxygenase [Micractinium conductrix]|eukprot:PSC71645.1 peptidyl-glycine alpha-amidating monooxygenase [Micractinium conductrix]